jgi:hypothetical protein
LENIKKKNDSQLSIDENNHELTKLMNELNFDEFDNYENNII